MPYIPHTEKEREQMLHAIGISSVEELFNAIPAQLRAKSFDIPAGKSELEIMQLFDQIAQGNASDLKCFLGGGFYDHYIPAAVDSLAGRSEFYTAYTPYQPECSQGTLQAIYEYQTAICRLTGFEASNASLYDGGTALYEAILMAVRTNNRNRVLVDQGVNPLYRKMLHSYCKNTGIELSEISLQSGVCARNLYQQHLNDSVSAVILQNPNFFGTVDDYTDLVVKIHAVGAVAIASVYPISLGLIKTPGEMGFDIATGEGQSLGIPLSFGGPYLGFLTTKKEHVRKMPGRIAGMTHDEENRRGIVLTLQAREQHIRREKATSNICSNEALCALRALIYIALVGNQGLKEVARICYQKTEYMKTCLRAINGVEISCDIPTFNEFVVTLPCAAQEVNEKMLARGIASGIVLGEYFKDMNNNLLVSVTEKRTRYEIEQYAKVMEDILWKK